MSYLAIFAAAVGTDRKDAYVAHSREAWERIFAPLGALRCVEAWGDDVPDGEVTSFPMAVRAGPDETVVVGWIEWPDRATHDAANARMREPDFEAGLSDMGAMPFDGARMIFGGFAPILELRA